MDIQYSYLSNIDKIIDNDYSIFATRKENEIIYELDYRGSGKVIYTTKYSGDPFITYINNFYWNGFLDDYNRNLKICFPNFNSSNDFRLSRVFFIYSKSKRIIYSSLVIYIEGSKYKIANVCTNNKYNGKGYFGKLINYVLNQNIYFNRITRDEEYIYIDFDPRLDKLYQKYGFITYMDNHMRKNNEFYIILDQEKIIAKKYILLLFENIRKKNIKDCAKIRNYKKDDIKEFFKILPTLFNMDKGKYLSINLSNSSINVRDLIKELGGFKTLRLKMYNYTISEDLSLPDNKITNLNIYY